MKGYYISACKVNHAAANFSDLFDLSHPRRDGPGRLCLALKKFVFKIKTKSGGIVSNIVIEAKDQFAAIAKLMKRYPGCEILEGREK